MALLRRLPGDTEGVADLGPRATSGTGLLDDVLEQLVGQLLDLLTDGRRHFDASERIVSGLLDGGDQLLQIHVSILP